MRRVRVVHVPAGKPARVQEIEDTLAAMQALVGGYIESVSVGGAVRLVCNEDGIALGLPQNGFGVLGPYFFTKIDEDGDNVDLDDAECARIAAHVAAYRGVRHPGTADIEVRSHASFEEWAADLRQQQFHSDHRN